MSWDIYLLDESGSMGPSLEEQREAAKTLVQIFWRHAQSGNPLPFSYLDALEKQSQGLISPPSSTEITRACVDAHSNFSQAASDQALREALSADMERRINDVRADMALPSLREAAAAKKAEAGQPPSYRSSEDIMAAVRSMSRGGPVV